MKVGMKAGFVLLTLVMLAGCATSYGPKVLAGGYSEEPVNENTITVTFEGNQYSNTDQIRTYLTYRCAEVTLEHGFSHFMILEDKSFKELGTDELTDEGLVFETTTSMSGGTNTRVTSGFEKVPTENLTGCFTIQMMHGVDPVYSAASIDAQVFLDTNKHLIKRKK